METVNSNHSDVEIASLLEKVCFGNSVSYFRLNVRALPDSAVSFMLYRLFLQEIRPGMSEPGVRSISGIICESKVLRFERMLFRVTRGNMLFNQAPADEEVVNHITSEKVSLYTFFLAKLLYTLNANDNLQIPKVSYLCV